MNALLALLILLVSIWMFGDLLVQLICRFVAFSICLATCCWLHETVARLLLDSGLVEQPRAAVGLSFLVVALTGWELLLSIRSHVGHQPLSDARAVALDGVRVGLVAGVGLTTWVLLAALSDGTLRVVTWLWITGLALILAGIDVCCPAALDSVAAWCDGSSHRSQSDE